MIERIAKRLAHQLDESGILKRYGSLDYLCKTLGESHAVSLHMAKMYPQNEKLQRKVLLAARNRLDMMAIEYLPAVVVGGAARVRSEIARRRQEWK